MARLFYMPFEQAAWFRDTKCLSFHAKGCWIDLVCILWDAETRGTKTFDWEGWAAELGKPINQIQAAFSELSKRHICDIVTERNGDEIEEVMVTSRRQVREEKARQQGRSRAAKFRERKSNAPSNASVTVDSKSYSHSQSKKEKKKETRSRMPENWSLSDVMREFGKKKGMTPPTIEHEFEHCKERHASALFLDWSGVWRTWCLNWISFGCKQVGGNGAVVSLPKAFRKIESAPANHEPMPPELRKMIGSVGREMSAVERKQG